MMMEDNVKWLEYV